MTGFASVTREGDRGTVGVTVRSVNHRYFDLQLRVPPAIAELEARLRALAQRKIARGRLEIVVSLQLRQTSAMEVELNEDLIEALGAALDRARERGLVAGTLTPGDLLRMPQAFAIREKPMETAAAVIGGAMEVAVEQALDELDGMRAREGGHLAADLERHLTAVGHLVESVATAAEEGRAALEVRLADRVRELSLDLQVDPAAIAQEIVRTAARSDITEELVRFRSHVQQWRALAEAPEPCGRKLDFLLQEMNREVNTMGAKADGARVSELIVSAKAELEKMREQAQNVE